MKKFLLGTVSSLALATAAGAADMPLKAAPLVAPIQTWAGFYVGVQGGIAANRGSFTDLDNLTSGLVRSPEFGANKTGGLLGVNAGYNFQSGNVVYGLEGDWSWLGAKASSSSVNNIGVFTASSFSFDARWLATARARLGLAAGATLFYATGGVAFAEINNNATVNFNAGPPTLRGTFSESKTKVGWTAGGGIEHMFAPHWTARIEGRYVDLGQSTRVSCGVPCNNGVGTYRGEFRNNGLAIGLLAVDYKF